MTRLEMIHKATWTALYALVAVVATIGLLVATQSLVGSVLLLVAVLAFAMLYRAERSVAARPGRHAGRPRPFIDAGQGPGALYDLTMADGRVLAARIVPIKQTEGHRLLLTATGYVVVDDTGRVVHRFGPHA